MKALLYSSPMITPPPLPYSDESNETLRQDITAFCKRASELARAAALVAGEEPGLLLPQDREDARRRGQAAARRLLSGCAAGKPQIAFYRTLTGSGLTSDPTAMQSLANRIWILEDRCGLADSYLRAVADSALQHRIACILCPNPIRRDRLEAVFLPDAGAAFLSARAADKRPEIPAKTVHLDRIPDSERRSALRKTLRDNRSIEQHLIDRAAQNLASAEILRSLVNDSCTSGR